MLDGVVPQVVLRALVAVEPYERDAPQSSVGLPVAAPVEPVTAGLAAAGLDRTGAAERGKGLLVREPLGVVAGGK